MFVIYLNDLPEYGCKRLKFPIQVCYLIENHDLL